MPEGTVGLDVNDVAELARAVCACGGAAVVTTDGDQIAAAGESIGSADGRVTTPVPALPGVPPAMLCVSAAAVDDATLELLERLAGQVAHCLHDGDATIERTPLDELTGLPRRRELDGRLAAALERARAEDGAVAVIFVDVDGFKSVNDMLGHQAGDNLLRHTAAAIQRALRPGDMVARVGGDEFVAVCEGLPDREAALLLAERLVECVSGSVQLDGHEAFVSVSVGVALAAAPLEPEAALRNADMAMYEAKRQRPGGVVTFDEPMRAQMATRLDIASALRRALDRDEFVLAYQPIVSVDSNMPVMVEALLRWQRSPDRVLSPAEFLRVAEDTRLIVPIGHWALTRACLDAADWAKRTGRPLGVTVNLSARQLGDVALLDAVLGALEESGLPPGQLVLEVTETELVASGGVAEAALGRLRDVGVGLALDDFGTGYSSLSYLSRLPFNFLKLDRSFVEELSADRRRGTIVMAVTQMARLLGMRVVAEGVEGEAQLRVLRSFRCDLAQGFLFARPAPAEAIVQAAERATIRARG